MTRQRSSAVFFSLLLVVSAATAAVPASALAPTADLGAVGNESGDADGDDGVTNRTDSTTADTDAPSVNPTVTDATDANGVVSDGDEVRIEAAAVDDSTGVANVTADATALGAGLVTLTHRTGDTYAATVTVADAANGTYPITVTATDEADNENATDDSILVDNAAPEISYFSVSSSTAESTLEIELHSGEQIETLEIGLTDSNGRGTIFTNLSESAHHGIYEYTINYRVNKDDTYHVTIVNASDAAGNRVTDGPTDETTVDTTAPTVTNFSATTEAGAVTVSFDSGESLADISVAVSGPETATLTEADFSRTGAGTYSATYAPETDGEYALSVERAADGHGNDGAAGQTDSAVVDTTAPGISNFTATSTVGRTVAVTFDSDESLVSTALVHEGLTAVDYSENRTADGHAYRWTLEADADGKYTVSLAEAEDARGNDGADGRRDSAVVDTRAPDTAATLFGTRTDAGYASEVTVNLGATDELSGVSETRYRVDGGDWLTYTGNVTVSGDGERTVEFYSADAADNAETAATRTFTIDTRAPNSSASLAGDAGDSGWFVSPVDANVTAADETTAVERTQYRVGDGEWERYAGNVTISGEGRHAFEYRSIDAAGRVERVRTESVEIDATDPATRLVTNATANDRGWRDSDVRLNLSAADATSGVAETRYRVDGGDWLTYDGNVTLSEDGNRTVEFYSVDIAGNEEARRTRTVRIDATGPEFGSRPSLDRTAGIQPESAIRVVADARDGQGVADVTANGVSIGPDGEGWVPAASKLGNHTVEVVVRDLAGNRRVAETGEYRVGRAFEMNRTDDGTLSAETDDSNVGEVTIDPESQTTGNASVEVGTAESNPTDSEVGDGASLYFPQINATVSNDNIESATVTLGVERSRVRQKHVMDGTVEFWVRNETTGEWATVDARRVGRTDDADTYEIDAPHFSTYAVTGDTESAAPNVTGFGTANESVAAGDVTLSASYADGYSGIDPANVTLTLAGDDGPEDVTSEAAVNASGLAFTRNLSAGTYDATLSLTDNANNPESQRISFTVANRSSGGGGGGGGGGGAGGGGAPPPSVRVSVVELARHGFRAEVVNARSGSPGEIAPEGGIAAGDLTVEGVTVTPESADAEARFFVDAAVGESPPDGASGLDATELGYLDVGTTYISGSAVSAVGVTFSVPAEAVAAPENVALYRLENGSWARVETAVVGERGDRYVLRASAAGTGAFAVGTRGDSATDATSGAERAESDGTAEATATDSRDGDSGDGAGDDSGHGANADSDGNSGSNSVPGLGVSTALVALLAGLLVARRSE